MKTRKIRFENTDGIELSAELDLPTGAKAHHYALFAHCFTCSKNLLAVKRLSKGLTDKGYGVFKFDFTGLGSSDGDFADTNFSSNVEDLISAANYMEKHYASPHLIIGHSLGGAAALQAAHFIKGLSGVVTIGAPYDPEHVSHLFDDWREEIHQNGKATVTLAGRKFTIKKQFLEDLQSDQVNPRLHQLNQPLLILHSPQDEIVGIENAAQIYKHAEHPKSFISMDGSDHLLTKHKDANYVGGVIAEWAVRYVGGDDNQFDSEQTKKDAVAELHYEDKFTTDVQTGTHRWVADEPKDVGGHNEGPAPGQLLMSALATCSAMTVMMYVRRKKWPLKCIRVYVHKKETDKAIPHATYVKEVELVGPDMTEKQQNRCLEIAGRCPVHRILSVSSEIESVLKNK
ncbi:MAG: alpha/beta fold hydrolase [Bacteroidetes bacterium]|jgi:putative redox protein|nr:alpha/beta fold hydrolase [Bacteroidota bacterium]